MFGEVVGREEDGLEVSLRDTMSIAAWHVKFARAERVAAAEVRPHADHKSLYLPLIPMNPSFYPCIHIFILLHYISSLLVNASFNENVSRELP